MALMGFFQQLLGDEKARLFWLGSGCSPATEPTAEISHYFNITQVQVPYYVVTPCHTVCMNTLSNIIMKISLSNCRFHTMNSNHSDAVSQLLNNYFSFLSSFVA